MSESLGLAEPMAVVMTTLRMMTMVLSMVLSVMLSVVRVMVLSVMSMVTVVKVAVGRALVQAAALGEADAGLLGLLDLTGNKGVVGVVPLDVVGRLDLVEIPAGVVPRVHVASAKADPGVALAADLVVVEVVVLVLDLLDAVPAVVVEEALAVGIVARAGKLLGILIRLLRIRTLCLGLRVILLRVGLVVWGVLSLGQGRVVRVRGNKVVVALLLRGVLLLRVLLLGVALLVLGLLLLLATEEVVE